MELNTSKETIKQIRNQIKKRDGRLEDLLFTRSHFVVEEACEGLAGVIETHGQKLMPTFNYDGMTTKEVQQILVRPQMI